MKKRNIMTISFISILALSTLIYLGNESNLEAEGEDIETSPGTVQESPNLPPPNLGTLEENQFVHRVVFAPLHRTTLSCEVAVATVQSIFFHMGDSFHQGDLLMKLDDAIFKGLLVKAQGAVEKAKAEVEAKQELYKENIASMFEVKAALADLASAESDVINAQKEIDSCSIIAPYDGKVVNVFVEEHEVIQQGKPLIEIVDDSILLGKLLIPSNLFTQLYIGKEVEIDVVETHTKVIGKIFRIDSVIDPASSLIKVDVQVDNKDGALRSGMLGNLKL